MGEQRNTMQYTGISTASPLIPAEPREACIKGVPIKVYTEAEARTRGGLYSGQV